MLSAVWNVGTRSNICMASGLTAAASLIVLGIQPHTKQPITLTSTHNSGHWFHISHQQHNATYQAMQSLYAVQTRGVLKHICFHRARYCCHYESVQNANTTNYNNCCTVVAFTAATQLPGTAAVGIQLPVAAIHVQLSPSLVLHRLLTTATMSKH